MKHIVLDQVKQELSAVINVITLDTLNESMDKIQTYFNFLESLKNLPTVSEHASALESEVLSPPITESKPLPQNVYLFERKLRGGIVVGYHGGYPLPEKLVRDMGIEHGDKVTVIDTIYINGQPRARFDVVEKGNGTDAPSRVQLDYCIVEDSSNHIGLQVSQYAGGHIMVDGERFTFKLSQRDILDYNVRSGDIIDIAYYDNNIDSIRVLWKHDIQDMPETTKQTVSSKKQLVNDDAEDEGTKYPIDLTLFKGKNLVIVGSEYEKFKYQKACDMLGIDLTHMSGDEGKVRLRTAIKKADVVVVTIQHVGHKGSVPTAELCKEYSVPMAAVDRNGVQHILLEAERVMKRKIEQTA